MADFPTLSRMPGSDSALGADDFDPGEVAGMRTAGWILVASAAIELLTWLMNRNAFGIIGVAADVVLGIQLLRLRHSWRAWTMLRAALGVGVGALIVVGGLIGSNPTAIVAVGIGQIAYCGSLFLLLYSRPTPRRVLLGRIVFAVSMVLLFTGGVLVAMRRPAVQPAAESRTAVVTAVMGSSTVLITGPTGVRVAEHELANIQNLIVGSGRPWLLIGQWPERSQKTRWPVYVFFEPDVTTSDLRLGNATM